MRSALDLALSLVQLLVWLVAVELPQLPHHVLRLLGSISGAMVRGPYYSVARLRRRIKNEPLWQHHDRMIGVPAPTEHLDTCTERLCTFERSMRDGAASAPTIAPP